MTRYRRMPVGQLRPGDVVYFKERGRFYEHGMLASAKRNVERRSVALRFADGSGFSCNWATQAYVRKEQS